MAETKSRTRMSYSDFIFSNPGHVDQEAYIPFVHLVPLHCLALEQPHTDSLILPIFSKNMMRQISTKSPPPQTFLCGSIYPAKKRRCNHSTLWFIRTQWTFSNRSPTLELKSWSSYGRASGTTSWSRSERDYQISNTFLKFGNNMNTLPEVKSI